MDSEDDAIDALVVACEPALVAWTTWALRTKPSYVDSVVGMHHVVDVDLLARALDEVRRRLATRGFDIAVFDRFAELDVRRRKAITESGDLSAERNRLSPEIGALMKDGRKDEAEAKRLRDLLSLSEKLTAETVTARVLVRPATPWVQTCTIGAGSSDGVKVGSAVVGGRGLVGMVFTMQPRTSQVLLIRDATSSVASLVQRTRAPGICSGDGGEMLRMMYIPLASDVRKGDSVLSSGDGGVFPKGIVVGTVESVTAQKHEHFKTALIRPAVEPRSLEEVLVVVERP